ncbi:MFS transporter [Rhodohalobacter sp. SW132]|uniref:spinster family MFS transporter n=1 Tax=Rhodohalobacter sp. SW132 TaxID=2293433 RepID=UPI000E2607B3|nr:MFS transporter [Rhodohalobacter sp. SW132]REL25064.1 MFS transporter [Rhodohalobacter sp. SW132]
MKKKLIYSALFVLTLVYINSFFTRQIVAVLGVDIREAFQLGNLQVGFLYGTAFSVIYAVAGIPMGRLADRISRRWMIAAGLLVWSVMTALSGFATSFSFLVTARILVGLSQATLSPAVYSLLADMFPPEKRATIFSLYASGIFMGIGLSFLAGGTIAAAYDWQIALIAVGIPGLVLVPFVLWIVPEPDRQIVRHTPSQVMVQDIKRLISKKTVQYHLIGFSMLACTGYTVLAFAGTIFNDVFQRPDLTPQYGWFLFGVSLTVILSGRVADKIAKKDPSRRFLLGTVAALGGLPFYAWGLFHSEAQMAYWMLGIGVLFSSSYNGVGAALMQFLVPSEQRALAGGVYLFVISIVGFGLGPPFAGWLMDSVFTGPYGASQSLFSVMMVCSIGSTIAFWRAMHHYRRDAID